MRSLTTVPQESRWYGEVEEAVDVVRLDAAGLSMAVDAEGAPSRGLRLGPPEAKSSISLVSASPRDDDEEEDNGDEFDDDFDDDEDEEDDFEEEFEDEEEDELFEDDEEGDDF